jgi:uncharacterized RDD family membrane protein YckC
VTYPAQPQGTPGPQQQSWGVPGQYTPQQGVPQGGYVVPPAQYGPPGYRPPAPKPTAPDGRPLAEFSDRLLAFLIDMAVFLVVGLILAVPAIIAMFAIFGSAFEFDAAGNVTNDPSPASIFLPILAIYATIFLIAVVFSYVYEVELVLRRNGQTWGKKAMKIQMVALEPGAQLTRALVTKRWLIWYVMGQFVPFFRWIDGLWQLWDQPYRQCLHDKWAGTVVIKVGA